MAIPSGHNGIVSAFGQGRQISALRGAAVRLCHRFPRQWLKRAPSPRRRTFTWARSASTAARLSSSALQVAPKVSGAKGARDQLLFLSATPPEDRVYPSAASMTAAMMSRFFVSSAAHCTALLHAGLRLPPACRLKSLLAWTRGSHATLLPRPSAMPVTPPAASPAASAIFEDDHFRGLWSAYPRNAARMVESAAQCRVARCLHGRTQFQCLLSDQQHITPEHE